MDFPGYEVSDLGRVRSNINRWGVRQTPLIMKPQKVRSKKRIYFMVHLSNQGISKGCLVHRLVAKAFIPNPQCKPQVAHRDNDSANNAVGNLKWATPSENEADKLEHGTWGWKANLEVVRQVRRDFAAGGVTQTELGLRHGLHSSTVSAIVRHEIWKDIA